jgi:hypothetical protein
MEELDENGWPAGRRKSTHTKEEAGVSSSVLAIVACHAIAGISTAANLALAAASTLNVQSVVCLSASLSYPSRCKTVTYEKLGHVSPRQRGPLSLSV